MKVLLLVFLLTCGRVGIAQDSKAAQAFAGCYELRVKGWHPFTSFDLLPTRFQLTTRPIERGFAVKSFDASVRKELPLSSWNLKDDGKIEIIWSTGFVGWEIRLSRDLRGTARSFADVDPQPSGDVTVVIRAVDCRGFEKSRSDQR